MGVRAFVHSRAEKGARGGLLSPDTYTLAEQAPDNPTLRQLCWRKAARVGALGARQAWQGREWRRQRNGDPRGRFIGQIRCTEAANEANPEMGIRATPQKFICL